MAIERYTYLQCDKVTVPITFYLFSLNTQTLMKREILGLIADEDNQAFETRHLKRLFAKAPHREPHTLVHRVYVSIDPNGGASGTSGTGSETAVVSFFYEAANIVVLPPSFFFTFFAFFDFYFTHVYVESIKN